MFTKLRTVSVQKHPRIPVRGCPWYEQWIGVTTDVSIGFLVKFCYYYDGMSPKTSLGTFRLSVDVTGSLASRRSLFLTIRIRSDWNVHRTIAKRCTYYDFIFQYKRKNRTLRAQNVRRIMYFHRKHGDRSEKWRWMDRSLVEFPALLILCDILVFYMLIMWEKKISFQIKIDTCFSSQTKIASLLGGFTNPSPGKRPCYNSVIMISHGYLLL